MPELIVAEFFEGPLDRQFREVVAVAGEAVENYAYINTWAGEVYTYLRVYRILMPEELPTYIFQSLRPI